MEILKGKKPAAGDLRISITAWNHFKRIMKKIPWERTPRSCSISYQCIII
jgi:hypothetical protein